MDIGIRNNKAYIMPEREPMLFNKWLEMEMVFHFPELKEHGTGSKKYLFTTVGYGRDPFCGLILADNKRGARRAVETMIKENRYENLLNLQLFQLQN